MLCQERGASHDRAKTVFEECDRPDSEIYTYSDRTLCNILSGQLSK
ncbi:hypothetical protein QUB13_25340 [Microcoleus sp. B4-D4]